MEREPGGTRTVRSNLLPPPATRTPRAARPRRLADNRLKTSKYTLLSFLPKNLFEQFHRLANVYFVFIALLNFVPAVNAFQPGLALAPVLFILAVTAFKDLHDHSPVSFVHQTLFSREEKKYVNRFWKEIHVGDFVRLRCNEIIPADILLLSSSDPDGLCHIETANLDGETNLKRRQVVRGFSELVSEFNPLMFTSVIECEKPKTNLTRFGLIHDNGKKAGLYKENLLLRGCTLRNTDAVVGIVIYAGRLGASPSLCADYESSMARRHGLWIWRYQEKKSSFYVPNSDGSSLSPVTAAVYSFLTMIIVLQVLIPISLYVSIEIVKVCQVYFINQDMQLYDEETDSQLQCRALNITEDLGQIQYIFSDKTGTLTENKMLFRRCTVSGVEYSHDANGESRGGGLPTRAEPESCPIQSCLDTHHTNNTEHTHTHRETDTHTHRHIHRDRHTERERDTHTETHTHTQRDRHTHTHTHSECDRSLAAARHQEHPLAHLSPELSDVFDFFIALTICNTVVVTSPDQPRQKASAVTNRHGANLGGAEDHSQGASSYSCFCFLCNLDDARGRHQKKIRSKTQNYLNLYAVEGLRTLCIAKRVLSKEEYACWLQSHLEAESSLDNREELLFQSAIRLETNLHLLGATGIEDRLQDGVPETVAKLRQAGLQIWVLTGDKQETAVNIAYACKLLDHDEEVLTLNAESQEACAALLDQCLHYVQSRGLHRTPEKTDSKVSVGFSPLCPPSTSTASGPSPSLVIDGRSLAYALEKNLEDKFLFLAKQCRSVLCCRSTPLQKSMVVKLVRSKLKAMTLAIGDGANDVSMIQVADVGVGISGQEGMQAVMASDFAVPRFRYLERLLIVHGHWCYSRLANMVLYFFYKNTMFVGLLFWFQFFCGFSASAMIDQWYLIFFNLLFSSLPQLVTGVLDRDVPADALLTKPQLYKSGQNMEEYRPGTFWFNMADAAFQSLVCFFIPYLAYHDSNVDLFTWGTPITTIALLTFLLHLGIETRTWTWLNWITCGFSVLLFFTVALIYNASCATCYPPSNPYWTIQALLGDPVFYLTCLVTPVAALLPRLFFKSLQGSLFPTQLQLARQLARKSPRRLSAPKETFAQGCLPRDPGTEHSEGRTIKNSVPLSQTSWHTWQPARSPEASREPSAVDVSVPLRDHPLLEGLSARAPRSSAPGEAVPGGCPEEPKVRAASSGRATPLSSLFSLPTFSSVNWISSLSLVSRLGSVLQFSRSSLHVDKRDVDFLSRLQGPDQELLLGAPARRSQ
uniref:Phospholipid-transporting ATPase n=1 Tax=Aotus nancymaae TaxID=37293 RepID=A0A2K5D327_AOTNA